MLIHKNIIAWFEIPVAMMSRAIYFYEGIFDIKLHAQEFDNFKMAFFPVAPFSDHVSGALCQGPAYKPSMTGVMIYFHIEGDLQKVLFKVVDNGGTVLVEKREIAPDLGFMAIIQDTEGNRIALHSKI